MSFTRRSCITKWRRRRPQRPVTSPTSMHCYRGVWPTLGNPMNLYSLVLVLFCLLYSAMLHRTTCPQRVHLHVISVPRFVYYTACLEYNLFRYGSFIRLFPAVTLCPEKGTQILSLAPAVNQILHRITLDLYSVFVTLKQSLSVC